MQQEHRLWAGALGDFSDQDQEQQNVSVYLSEPAPSSASPSHREKDEAYSGVIVQLDDCRRVINSADDLCWIVQKKSGRYWRGWSYHRDRSCLIQRCHPLSGDALAILQGLEAFHP